MQQLRDKANNTDSAFMRELFLRLPSNMCIVFTSTADAGNLNDLTQLANKIMEVVMPSVSSVYTYTKFEHLRQEAAEVKRLIQTLKQIHGHSLRPAPPREQVLFWYHTKFGDSTKKCKLPCAKSPENSQTSH